ncbi:hypothetical protein GCM10010219_59950 [Streptomyces netropsis]|nr:hypothetical protein GCM10010219_59950 [Streptomyces netropsis]
MARGAPLQNHPETSSTTPGRTFITKVANKILDASADRADCLVMRGYTRRCRPGRTVEADGAAGAADAAR